MGQALKKSRILKLMEDADDQRGELIDCLMGYLAESDTVVPIMAVLDQEELREIASFLTERLLSQEQERIS